MMEPPLSQIVKGPGENMRRRRISDLLTQLCVHVCLVSFTHACSSHHQDTHEERKEQQQPSDSPVMTCDTLRAHAGEWCRKCSGCFVFS